ncbi:MAG TPA: Plug domain-containing protein, partial [Longimicrobiales bacterium]|nr:Plug domain-containing protein [Longimicrobiales bacterium]
MSGASRRSARGGPWLRPGAVFVALLALLAPAALRAQDPVPPDTLPADTLAPDTAALDSLARAAQDTTPPDTLPPPPLLPLPDVPPDTGWAAGVWEWDRAALLGSTALTLGDLLERVPSAVVYRSGFLGMPEGVSVLGMNAGRVELVLDGFVLDPLDAGAFDLARIELVTLERVRVVRRMDGVRVELESAAPASHRPYSRGEASTGYFDTEIFRGLFLAPRFLFGPLGLGIERVETDGVNREGADRLTLWGKWGLTRERWGVQLEGRRSTLGREETAPLSGELRRSDLVLRGRAAPLAGLVLEAYAGTSSLTPELPEDTLPIDTLPGDTLPGDTLPGEPPPVGPIAPLPDSIARTAVDGRQMGVRAALRRGPLWARAAVRHRDAEGLP